MGLLNALPVSIANMLPKVWLIVVFLKDERPYYLKSLVYKVACPVY